MPNKYRRSPKDVIFEGEIKCIERRLGDIPRSFLYWPNSK